MSSLKSSGASYTLANGTAPYSPWSDTGGTMLTDGVTQWNNWRVGWLSGGTPRIDVNLGSQKLLDYVRFAFHVWQPANVYAPSQVIIKGSNDGSAYTTLGTFVRTTDWDGSNIGADASCYGRYSNNLSSGVNGTTYQYVRFEFSCDHEMSLAEVEIYGDDVIIPTTNYLKGRSRNRVDFRPISGAA